MTGKYTDRRDVLEAADKGDPECQLALAVETRTVKKTIGSYAAAMGGLDCVVFTAGVGENSPAIRSASLQGLAFLGIELDEEKNRLAVGGKEEMLISSSASHVAVAVIPTNEELVIAEDTLAILNGDYEKPGFSYSFS